MCIGLDWYAESSAKAQVGNFQAGALVIHEEVLWLEVSVHDAVLVAVSHTLDELVHETLQQPYIAPEL